jgi:transposase
MRTDQTFTTLGEEVVLAVSLELAAAKWKVALHDGRREKPAVHTVAQPQAAARLQAVLDLIERHKEKWSLPAGVRTVVSYEAGQDAFWICRALQARGIECYVVDPASIPVERHRRRAKTDRLDVIKLITNLRAWLRGERDRMHVVHVPSPQDEASRQLMRDRGELQKEVLQHRDRMRKLLVTLVTKCGATTARRCRPSCVNGCCASANGWHWRSSNSPHSRRRARRACRRPRASAARTWRA